MRILSVTENDADNIRLVRRSLLALRKCYPEFASWFDIKIVPHLSSSRKIYLAELNGEFQGSLILKNTKTEKKVCTLYVREESRFNGLGGDFIRIATEELETYKLPITVNEEVKNSFFNARSFNFLQKEKRENMYSEGSNEYIGFIMAHNPDKQLQRRK